MKYIIGIILGIILASSVVVYAKSGMEVVNLLNTNFTHWQDGVQKVYDNDNGAVCYIVFGYHGAGSSPAISCLK